MQGQVNGGKWICAKSAGAAATMATAVPITTMAAAGVAASTSPPAVAVTGGGSAGVAAGAMRIGVGAAAEGLLHGPSPPSPLYLFI